MVRVWQIIVLDEILFFGDKVQEHVDHIVQYPGLCDSNLGPELHPCVDDEQEDTVDSSNDVDDGLSTYLTESQEDFVLAQCSLPYSKRY